MKETTVIYLNEERDKPKVEEPLDFKDWFFQLGIGGLSSFTSHAISLYANQWLEYRNNFKVNDKPIEFTNVVLSPSKCQLIVVRDIETFTCFDENGELYEEVKGNLNNGKVK